MARHPNNGPTFSKPTIGKPRSTPSSPDRNRAQLEQDVRDAAKRKTLDHELKTNPAAFIQRIVARTKKLRGEEEE